MHRDISLPNRCARSGERARQPARYGRVRHKPGSVLRWQAPAGQLSIWDGRYRPPHAVSPRAETPGTGLEKTQPYSHQPCTQPGFTEPAPLGAAGALLPHLCTLTPQAGRYFSVALSSRSLALGVTQQVWALGCPDFPQPFTPKRQWPQLPHWLFHLKSIARVGQTVAGAFISWGSRGVRLSIRGGGG
jgi:hypothetical protein